MITDRCGFCGGRHYVRDDYGDLRRCGGVGCNPDAEYPYLDGDDLEPVGVTQEILVGQIDGVPGDCMRACVATILEITLDEVPHFALFKWWEQALDLWVAGHVPGYNVDRYDATTAWGDRRGHRGDTVARYMLGGTSPRGVKHVVVAEAGETVWDPHPSRAGLTEATDVWVFRRR